MNFYHVARVIYQLLPRVKGGGQLRNRFSFSFFFLFFWGGGEGVLPGLYTKQKNGIRFQIKLIPLPFFERFLFFFISNSYRYLIIRKRAD
jgi:hypothetical protein